MTKTWHVHYTYDGGAGHSTVEAPDRETAIMLGMPAAKPAYASDPHVTCAFTGAYRVLRSAEVYSELYGGISTVIHIDWSVRDALGPWLVVKRGHGMLDLRDYWTDVAALVSGHTQYAAAVKRATHLQRSRALLYGVRYDVVPRAAVVFARSKAPYGTCL